MKTLSSNALSAIAVLAALTGMNAVAQDAQAEVRERCATRVSIALLGLSPDAELQAAEAPQAFVDQYLESATFIERFSRFANQQFNDEPGANAEEDAPYFLVKEVLTRKLPWKEVFAGQWTVKKDSSGVVRAMPDAEGLGYFRSPAWLRRYAGNEPDGYKIATAYRIMNNVLGLHLVAATNAPEVDITSKGREAAACRSCHYEGPFALDLVARVLTRRVGDGNDMTFEASTEAPQTILGGRVIHDDKELVNALVNSEDFRFNSCRLAFKFLYGRAENSCEGEVFDRCMQAFAQAGTIQSALRAVAADASFCQ